MLFLILFSLCIALLSFPIFPTAPLFGTHLYLPLMLKFSRKPNTALKMCTHNWDKDYSSLLSTFNLPTCSTRHSISKLCLLYKITNSLLYFLSKIFIHKPMPSYASHHFDPLVFIIPFSHSSSSQNSFVRSVLSLWNSLPYDVKSSPSLKTFKSKVNMLFLLTINSPSLITLKAIIYSVTYSISELFMYFNTLILYF